MCHSRTNKSKIDRLKDIYLRIICNDKQSSFKELLETGTSVSIHERNAQVITSTYERNFCIKK